MKVIIPVAGYATRLYPLTKNKPKALLEVKGKPILEHILKKVEELPGVSEIFIVSNDKYFENFDEWVKGFENKISIKVLNDGTSNNEDRSEEHTSELQSHSFISYAVFCLKKKIL